MGWWLASRTMLAARLALLQSRRVPLAALEALRDASTSPEPLSHQYTREGRCSQIAPIHLEPN